MKKFMNLLLGQSSVGTQQLNELILMDFSRGERERERERERGGGGEDNFSVLKVVWNARAAL